MRCRPEGAQDHPLLRRLTRAEFKLVRKTGVIPYSCAVALIVIPPLNRDPETRARPTPNRTSLPDPHEMHTTQAKPTLPLSKLLPTSEFDIRDEVLGELPKSLPSRVPFYNGVTLFPSRPQRAALHFALNHLLSTERKARARLRSSLSRYEVVEQTSTHARGDQKASHAYLLCSDAGTSLRADAVPVAIALWRVGMWEGGTLEDSGRDV